MSQPKNSVQKIWDGLLVAQQPDSPALLYIDRQLIHEVTSPQAFTGLRQRGLQVRRPDRTTATVDHALPTQLSPDGTLAGRLGLADALSQKQIAQLETNTQEFGIQCYGPPSARNGIVHVIGPNWASPSPA
jgi:3-isopropylmalate/(R)-2-methylmalate dehydratase large subunit